jgi:hypothetical protein
MKQKFFYLLSLFLFSAIMAMQPANAQDEITEGTDYWFGHPHTMKDVSEPVRWGIYPIELWISSKVNTIAYIESADGSMQKTPYEIKANEIRVLPISDVLENRESEVVSPKGIHITSEDPISVGVFTAYKWSGEAYRVIPVEWLGKEYVTMNMYQDYVNMYSHYKEYKPAQILIIATEDGTNVTYTPKWDTEGGVKAGESRTVMMNRGDTYLILGKIDPPLTQDWATDLSGSYIKANKPIGVISGHTKGGFPRFSASMYGIRADFVRNTLIEMLWPVELLGREYVSAPVQYEGREYGIVDDDEGDIIRFVAAYDDTEIMQMRQDGSTFKKIGPTLKKGEWFQITNSVAPGYYVANKPMLVGQYGKGWIANLPPPVADMPDKDDEMMNPRKNGQGMMLILAPIERWCTYATFRAPPKMNNYVYLTFRTDDRQKIKFDDQYIHITFGEAQLIPIAGSDYSYLAHPINAGNHYVEADDGARFAGYCYGNWDAYKDGFAYGYPIGINFADPCEDSLWVEETEVCGVIDGAVHAVDLQADTSCAGLYKVLMRFSESENYSFELDENFESGVRDATFHLYPTDPNKPAKAVLFFMTKSGKSILKEYTYEPESIASNPTTVDFGLMKVGNSDCKTFNIINTGDGPLTIHSMRLVAEQPEYELMLDDIDFPLVIAPGKEEEIEVCATALVKRTKIIWDYIEVELDCYTTVIDTLRMLTGIPIVWVGDADFGEVPIGDTKSLNVSIINQSDIEVEIYGIDWEDKDHFPKVENLEFPLYLKEGERHTFQVFYTPLDESGVQHTERAWFDCNTDTSKVYSDWTGIGIEAGPAITGYDWQYKRVIDDHNMSQGIYEYEGKVAIWNTGNTDLKVDALVIDGDDEGVFEVKTDNLPQNLRPNEPVELQAFFRPQAQIDYEASVTINTKFNNEILSASDLLLGAGLQPHINVTGYDFGELLIGTSNEDGIGTIIHTALPDVEHSMDLTITRIYIEGDEYGQFEIDPDFFVQNPYPITVKIGDMMEVPIKFAGKEMGTHYAEIVVESDAPQNSDIDIHRAELVGRVYKEGLTTSDHDYGTIFITTAGEGEVWLQNDGTKTMTIERPISQSVSGDINSFTIHEVITESGNTPDQDGKVMLLPGEKLFVRATFLPMDVQDYSMEIEYQTNVGTGVSTLVGSGKLIKTIVEVPKGYTAAPGDAPVTIDYLLKQHPDETKALASANIRHIKATVKFVPENTQADNFRNIYPNTGNDNIFDCSDIITNGTMLEGWNCEYANVADGVVTINMSTEGEPLSGNGVLFKFKMNTYLSDVAYIPLPPTLSIQDEASGYVVIEEIPGDFTIMPVCVDTLRLVIPSDVSYSLTQNVPNPVINKTTIGYSVGIEANTTITLYNNNSEEVGVLVNQNHKPGEYQIELDVNQLGLPSGVYHYRIESGPFKETRSFVITK